jgi:hypothetical protein
LDHEEILEHSKKMEEIAREKIELKKKETESTRLAQSYDYSKY